MLSLPRSVAKKGVITASAGNHGLGVAYAANHLMLNWQVVVPEKASSLKIRNLQELHGKVTKAGRDYDEAEEIAHQIEHDDNLTFVHAFDDPLVIAGQGTIALELLKDIPDLDTVVVPVGGGGLISGVAVALKSKYPQVRIFGVQPTASPAMRAALSAGKVVETPILPTLADGLAGRFVSELTLSITHSLVDDVVLVDESEIVGAIIFLFKEARIIVEGAAAVGVAAILSKKITLSSGNTIILITGRNIDYQKLTQLICTKGSK